MSFDQRSEEPVIFSKRDGTAVVSLNRPAKRNALSQQLITALLAALERGDADPDIRVIIITGAGGVFSAGADLKEIAELDFQGARRVRYLEQLCNSVAAIRKPVIAAVEAMALGGGFELALMCDLIVSSISARLGFPEVNVGLLPGAGGTQRLTAVVGKYRASKLILTGEPIGAAKAELWGLVSQLSDPGKALEDALELADLVGQKSLSATLLAKEAILRAENLGLDLEFERSLYYSAFGTEDKREGVAAFLEKRQPAWASTSAQHQQGQKKESSSRESRNQSATQTLLQSLLESRERNQELLAATQKAESSAAGGQKTEQRAPSEAPTQTQQSQGQRLDAPQLILPIHTPTGSVTGDYE